MSLILFELKQEHVKLLKNLRWSVNDKNLIVNTEEGDSDNIPVPFNENSIYDAIDVILNGRPEVFDPLNTEDIKVYTPEEKKVMDDLYKQLPIALEIIMYNGHFELGPYMCRFHDRQWQKDKRTKVN